jgi:VWFA-related protein
VRPMAVEMVGHFGAANKHVSPSRAAPPSGCAVRAFWDQVACFEPDNVRNAWGIPVWAAFCAMLISTGPAQALPQSDSPFQLRTETRVVQIEVSVHDAQGRPVKDLKEADFKVIDNGKSRAFTIFNFNPGKADTSEGLSLDAPTPLISRTLPPGVFTNIDATTRPAQGHSTIIVLDGINGWFDNFETARQSVTGLLARLPADESVAIYVLVKGIGMVVLQDYTTDRARLTTAVRNAIPRGMPPAPPHLPEGFEGRSEGPILPQLRVGDVSLPPTRVEPWHASAGEKALSLRVASDDVRNALNLLAEKLKSLPGRKSVFWVTQGFPPSQIRDQRHLWDKTFQNLNDSNVAVNTVDSNGVGGPPRFWGPGAILSLQEVAERTGGQALFQRNDLDNAMAASVENARESYTLGFYLTEMDGKYHELKVRVNRPALQVTHRRGYYARVEAVPDASTRKMPLQSALLNPSGSAEIRITASIEIAGGTPKSSLTAHLKLDVEPLSIRRTAAGLTGQIEELFLELNADGYQLAQFSDTKKFSVGTSEEARFKQYGLVLLNELPLAPGAEKLLIVVRDVDSGRTGSLAIPLQQFSSRSQQNL